MTQKALFLISVLAFSGLICSDRIAAEDKWAETTTATREPGLAGYWNFDEAKGKTALDVSGNNRNGTLVKTEWETGLQGSALRFNGKDAWVDCGRNVNLNSNDALTIRIWFNPDSGNTSEQCLLDKAGDFAVFFDGGQNRIRAGISDSGGKTIDLGCSLQTKDGWHQAVLTYDRKIPENNLKLYLDGMLRAEKPLSGGIRAMPGGILFLGRSATGNFYRGLIDEVKIYHQALNAGEIKESYSSATRQTPVL